MSETYASGGYIEAGSLAAVEHPAPYVISRCLAARLGLAYALSAPSGDAQGERAHGDGTAAQGSVQGDSGGKR